MKKKVVWKRVLVINSLLAVLVVATLAWFALWNDATLQSLSAEVTDAGYIRISKDGGSSWQDNLTLNLGESNILGELSGNGLSLYQPNYGVDGIEGFKRYTDSELYLEETFTFQSDSNQSLYLSDRSYVVPSNPSGNMSAYGPYSRDYIAGAIRVGFYEVKENASPQLIYIWAPNATLQFTESGIIENGAVEETYTYQVGTALNQTVTVPTNSQTAGVSQSGDFVWGNPNQNGVKPLLTFETSNNRPTEHKVMVRVWLEGSDRECVRQLHNGKFRIFLDFKSAREG